MPESASQLVPEPVREELLRDFAGDLRPRIRGDLRFDAMTRGLYATDASMYEIMPLAVVVPRAVEDVQAVIEEAVRRDIPVLPRGGGSSLAGQTVGAAVVVDFSKHLDAVLELNEEERWVRAQPGIVIDELNAWIGARSNMMIGPDPASSNRATLGGIVGNNATGTHSILYGNVVNHIRSVRAILADGSQADFGAVSEDVWAQRSRMAGLEGTIYAGIEQLLDRRGDVIDRDTPRHWRRNNGYRVEYLREPGPHPRGEAAGRAGPAPPPFHPPNSGLDSPGAPEGRHWPAWSG